MEKILGGILTILGIAACGTSYLSINEVVTKQDSVELDNLRHTIRSMEHPEGLSSEVLLQNFQYALSLVEPYTDSTSQTFERLQNKASDLELKMDVGQNEVPSTHYADFSKLAIAANNFIEPIHCEDPALHIINSICMAGLGLGAIKWGIEKMSEDYGSIHV